MRTLVSVLILVAVAGCSQKPEKTLSQAIQDNDIATVKKHIKAGTNINEPEKTIGYTPLIESLLIHGDKKDRPEIAKLLIEAGANIEDRGPKNKRTPLLISLSTGNVALANLLLEKGADVNVSDVYGISPLHLAAELDNEKIIYLLIKKGASPHALDADGCAPMHYAAMARKDNPEIIKVLASCKCDINPKDKSGRTPLHIAARKNNAKVIKELLLLGASINAKDSSGVTPLHCSAMVGNYSASKTLLDNGANPNSTINDTGITPLRFAKDHKIVAKLIKEYGGK